MAAFELKCKILYIDVANCSKLEELNSVETIINDIIILEMHYNKFENLYFNF